MRPNNHPSYHSRCDTIKISPCPQAISAEQTTNTAKVYTERYYFAIQKKQMKMFDDDGRHVMCEQNFFSLKVSVQLNVSI